MILRLLRPQGIAGIAIAALLTILLVIQKGETRHWRKQSDQFEILLAGEKAALAGTAANYRAAADRARAEDEANAQRVAAQQSAINERSADDFQTRLAAAHALAVRLREQAAAGAADPGRSGAAAVSGIPAAPVGPAKAADQDGLSDSDDALLATEQAIQLDELIKWVRQQHAVRWTACLEHGPRPPDSSTLSGWTACLEHGPKAAGQQHAVRVDSVSGARP